MGDAQIYQYVVSLRVTVKSCKNNIKFNPLYNKDLILISM